MTVESATYVNDLNASYPSGADSKNEGDNHITLIKAVLKATWPNMAGRAWRSLAAKTSNYSLAATDAHVIVPVTAASVTISTASAAATMGNGYFAFLYALSHSFIIDPNGSETVNGAAAVTIPAGHGALLGCDGSNYMAYDIPLAGPRSVISTKSTNYTVIGTDHGTTFNCTGALTLALTAVATLGDGFYFTVVNSSTAAVTLDPSGSELIGGAATKTIAGGSAATVFILNGAWYALGSSGGSYISTAIPVAGNMLDGELWFTREA